MRFQHLVCLLLASLTYGQTTAPTTAPTAGTPAQQSAPAAPDKSPRSKIGPTMWSSPEGILLGRQSEGRRLQNHDHKGSIRETGESLQPGMSPAIRRQLANRYGWILKMAAEAEKRGSTNNPRTKKRSILPACRFFRRN